jgi:hypothetical protein
VKKVLWSCFIGVFISASVSAFEGQGHDLILNTKLSTDWSAIVLSKIRHYMLTNKLNDPFNYKFDKTIELESGLDGQFDSNTKDLIENFSSLFGLKILNSSLHFSIVGLGYSMSEFSADLKTATKSTEGLTLALDFSAEKLRLSADKIIIGLKVPSMNGGRVALFNVEILSPTLKASSLDLVAFFVKARVENEEDNFKFKIKETNFTELAQNLIEKSDGFKLNYKISIPKAEVRVGNHSIVISQEKILKLLADNELSIKSLILSQFSNLLKRGQAERLVKLVEGIQLKKDFWLDTQIKSVFKLDKIKGHLENTHLSFFVAGDFCKPENFVTVRFECPQFNNYTPPASRLTPETYQQSVAFMQNLIRESDAAILLSASEDYINKLLLGTFHNGLWDKSLSENGIELGPAKLIARLDHPGKTASIYLDIVKRISGINRAALGSKFVRFPLLVKTSMSIEKNQGEIPVLIIRAEEVELDDELLLKGRPDLGMESNVKKLRLKKKVLSVIKSEIQQLNNTVLVKFKLPMFQGLGFENIIFESDGVGRVNGHIKHFKLESQPL